MKLRIINANHPIPARNLGPIPPTMEISQNKGTDSADVHLLFNRCSLHKRRKVWPPNTIPTLCPIWFLPQQYFLFRYLTVSTHQILSSTKGENFEQHFERCVWAGKRETVSCLVELLFPWAGQNEGPIPSHIRYIVIRPSAVKNRDQVYLRILE